MSSAAHKPLYQQLVDDILDLLSKGKLKKGDRLPPEADYAAKLGVSRSTVRLAFSHLQKAGIINRRKRGGTEIISVKPVQRFEMSTSGLNNVLTVATDTHFDLTDVRMVDSDVFCELPNYSNESTNWLRCTGTRSMENQTNPFVWSQIFVAERYSKIPLQAGDSPNSIFAVIEKQFGVPVNRVKQRYSAKPCNLEVSLALGLNESDPVLTLFAELLNDKGGLIQLAHSIFDPSRFKIVTDVNVSRVL